MGKKDLAPHRVSTTPAANSTKTCIANQQQQQQPAKLGRRQLSSGELTGSRLERARTLARHLGNVEQPALRLDSNDMLMRSNVNLVIESPSSW